MTKKELLEMPMFKSLPDDAEFVFATHYDVSGCVPLMKCHLTFEQYPVVFIKQGGKEVPMMKTFIKILAKPID